MPKYFRKLSEWKWKDLKFSSEYSPVSECLTCYTSQQRSVWSREEIKLSSGEKYFKLTRYTSQWHTSLQDQATEAPGEMMMMKMMLLMLQPGYIVTAVFTPPLPGTWSTCAETSEASGGGPWMELTWSTLASIWAMRPQHCVQGEFREAIELVDGKTWAISSKLYNSLFDTLCS